MIILKATRDKVPEYIKRNERHYILKCYNRYNETKDKDIDDIEFGTGYKVENIEELEGKTILIVPVEDNEQRDVVIQSFILTHNKDIVVKGKITYRGMENKKVDYENENIYFDKDEKMIHLIILN